MDRHQLKLCQGWFGRRLTGLIFAGLFGMLPLDPIYADPPGSQPDQPLTVPVTATSSPSESPANPGDIDGRIQQWIAELSSTEYSTRRQAFMELWKQGAVALPAVRAALSTSDQQTISNAKVLENLLNLGISPAENDDLAELLKLSPTNWDAVLRSVGQKGYWQLAADVIRNQKPLLNTIRDSYPPDQFCKLMQIAFDQGNIYQAWPVVSQGLSPVYRFYLTELTRKQLQAEYRDQIPADIVKSLNVVEDEAALDVDDRALLYLFTGRAKEAWELNPSPRVKQRIIYHSAEWEWLKDPAVTALSISGGANNLLRRTRLAAYSRLAYDNAKSDELVQQLRQEFEKADLSSTKNTPGMLQDILKALLVCGEGELVDELVQKNSFTVDVDYYTSRFQHEKALKKFGLDPKLENFDEWLSELPGKLNPNGPDVIAGTNRMDSYMELTRFLTHTGFTAQGKKLYLTLLESLRRLSGREVLENWTELLRRSEDHQLRQYLLEYLDANDSKLKPEERRIVLSQVFSEWQNTAEKLWQHAPAELAKVDGQSMRWRLLERLWKYDRTLVQDEESVGRIETWFNTAVREASKGEEATDGAVGELAMVAVRLGLRKQALAMVRTETTRNVLSDMAEMLTANGSLEAAGKWWESAIGQVPDQHMWIRRYADVLLMQGEAESAAKYETSIWLRPMENQQLQADDTTYAMTAEKYFDAGSYDLAQQYAEVALALGEIGEQGWRARRMAAMALEREDYATAARGSRIMILTLMATAGNFLRTPIDSLQFLQYYAGQDMMCNAAHEIQSGRMASALVNIRKFESISPSSIEICEHCYPLLVKAGEQAAADELLNRCAARMLKHLDAWPNDSNSHNNLAWMLARCNTRLPEAIEHATKAVELSDRSPTYVDTLAEAEFQAGHIDRAIELARECTESDPRHAHFQKQLARFRAAR